MAQGVYGTKIPATFTPVTDADVWFMSKNTDSNYNSFTKMTTSDFLEVDDSNISGLYKLKLSSDYFVSAGTYNVYIKPKEYSLTIKDVGVLSTNTDIRGIVISYSDINITDLTGYKIEYLDSNGNKTSNLFRIVTSSNRCEATTSNTNGVSSYVFNDTSSLMFLTLSPSLSSATKPSSLPYIGNANDSIVISNTFFNPELIEIELVENDTNTLTTLINGNRVRDLESGLETIYDDNNEILSQTERYILKSSETGDPAYEVKKKVSNITSNATYLNILNDN